jgi:hypothetical protein
MALVDDLREAANELLSLRIMLAATATHYDERGALFAQMKHRTQRLGELAAVLRQDADNHDAFSRHELDNDM